MARSLTVVFLGNDRWSVPSLRALAASEQKGASGDVLLKHFGVISPDDAKEILAAVEKGCERVDTGEW